LAEVVTFAEVELSSCIKPLLGSHTRGKQASLKRISGHSSER
jgi:hypothetical protein